MRQTLVPIAIVCACVGVARADYNPVPLTPGSFTQDIVIEKNAPPPLASFTTVTIDQGTNNYGDTFFEQGYIPSMPMMGLPAHGTTFASRSGPNHVFLMPPDYRTNNCAFVGSQNIAGTSTLQVQVPTATLTVNNPTSGYNALSILYAGGGYGTNVSVTVHHEDGSTELFPISYTLDWFNGSTNYAWIAQGRVAVDGSAPLNNLLSTSATKLFNVDITVNAGSPVTAVDFAWVTNIVSAGASDYRVFVFAISGSTNSGSTYTPMPVSGFNADVVVEAGAPVSYVQGCNVSFDGGPRNTGATMYEQDFATNNYADQGFNPGGSYNPSTDLHTGLPHPGSVLVDGAFTFVMPSTYVGNCSVFIGNYAAGAVSNGIYASPDYTTANITLPSPQPLFGLSLLDSSGGGDTVVGYAIDYDDGTVQTGGSLTVPDWFGGTGQIWTSQGRVTVINPGLSRIGVTSAAKLFHQEITPTNTTASVTNITLTWSSGNRAFFFGISAQTNSGGNYYPIPFSGFNADSIVEKEQPLFPGGLFSATTATMDLGTRNGNWTWFEQGWVTNGAARGSGLPPAGSTINSQQDATRHYQMPATYTGPNAVLIDTNHQAAYITPASPTAASAIALLTAGASIGSSGIMTNLCILFHADGSAETNVFYGYDWFNNSEPVAFSSNGRADTRWSIAGSLFNNPPVPRLFETFFPLANTVSPVTNILVLYQTAGGDKWTTYVLAVSATSGAVQPVLGTLVQSVGTVTNLEGSNVVFTVTSESGTAPITNQWQFSPDWGTTWVNVTDGGTISGANTLNLTNSSVGWTNTGLYRLVASNAAGTASTDPARLTLVVYSGLPDITLPADPVIRYNPNGGSSPGGEPVTKAIDDLVGSSSKYLNFGANDGSPFAGPIGLIDTPVQGGSIIKAIRIYTANDAPERDPADFTLEGSPDGGNTWTVVATNALALPTGRNNATNAPPNPLTQYVQEIDFYGNTSVYLTYRLSFANARNNSSANSIQVGEVELLGVLTSAPPVIAREPITPVNVYAGGSPTFGLVAVGTPAPSYQWYRNSVLIPGATNATYTTNNVQAGDSGSTFYCQVSNSAGSVSSVTATLNVISPPAGSYDSAILADHPVAYWPLSEGPDDGSGNNGVPVVDYMGGHDGVYSNAFLGQPGFNPSADPDTSVQFGYYAAINSYAGNIQDVDFAAPTNTATATFSVEAWVLNNPSSGVQTSDAGLVTKGYGGGEQFNLDCGAGGDAQLFRFFARDAAGAVHAANGTIGSTNVNGPFPNNGLPCWHHVVGVYDAPNSNVVLYVDGIQNGIFTGPLTNGILATPPPPAPLVTQNSPVSIGSRQSGAGTAYDDNFNGTMEDVAIYNFALSSNQVLAHYYAAQPLPVLTAQPTNTSVWENGPTRLYSSAYAPPTLTYQWYQSADFGVTYAPVADETNANLVFASTPLSYNNYLYEVVATDPYGSVTSSVVVLTVLQGPPEVVKDLPPVTVVYQGATVSLSVEVVGTLPYNFSWTSNGVALSDGGRISGTHSNVLTIADTVLSDDGAVYQLNISNNFGNSSSSPTTLYVETTPDFNTNGAGWTANGGAAFTSSNLLTVTTAENDQARSAWYDYPLYIGQFYASWVYQDVTTNGADGVAFCLQNDPRGTAALGGGGGALGLSGITPSAALTFNIYSTSPGGVGISFGVNGDNGSPYNSTAPVAIESGDPVYVSVLYDGATGFVTLNQTNTIGDGSAFTTNLPIGSLSAILGADTAYVGFTGATGGHNANQTVRDFVFLPLPTLSVQQTGPTSIMLSWPTAIAGYTLETSPSVSPTSWTAVTAPVNRVGDQYQVTISPLTTYQFFRLVLTDISP